MSRRVLVTGGSQGIGLAIARGCAAAGDAVTVLSRRPPATPSGLTHLPCDLREPDGVARALRLWLDAGGGAADALIHCAVAYGSNSRHPLVGSTVEEWDAAMAVTARGLLLVLRELLPALQRQKTASVIGLSSVVADGPAPGRIPYAASKAAARAILDGLAAELAGSAVAVVQLVPTAQVDTPGIRSRRPPDFVPDGYAAADSFVAPVLHLLRGGAARHHGACLRVDPEGRLLQADGTVIA